MYRETTANFKEGVKEKGVTGVRSVIELNGSVAWRCKGRE